MKDHYQLCVLIPEGSTIPVAWCLWNETSNWAATLFFKERQEAIEAGERWGMFREESDQL